MNSKETFDFYKAYGVLPNTTPEMRVSTLVNILIDALYIPVTADSLKMVDVARLEHFGIDGTEPINFGDLKCCHVEFQGNLVIVTIDEAGQNSCPTFCDYIHKYMYAWGWAVLIQTEW